jgi:hypothetical protein
LFLIIIKNLNLWQTIKKGKAKDGAIKTLAEATAVTKVEKNRTRLVGRIQEMRAKGARAVQEEAENQIVEIQEEEITVSSPL